MSFLFFGRRKPQPQHPDPFVVQPVAPPPVAKPAPQSAATSAPQPSAMRQVYALALNDERAVQALATPDLAQMNLLVAASQAFAKIGTEPRYTPRQPSMLAQVLEALSDDEASLRELSRIVSKDPQLTGNLLRASNSPMYRVSSSPVESVERAAALLGTTGIRTLLAASLMQPLATGPASGLGLFGEIVWEHSLYSASAAEAWAGRKADADPFTAHLLALMNGLGCVAVYRVLNDLHAAQPGLVPDAAVIADALETHSALIAARIATHWGLSERTRQALEAQSSAGPVNARSGLAQALQFGLLAGAMTMLCRKRKVTEEDGLARIEAGGFPGEPVPRIWDRLLLAYGRS
ncbi:MAG: HDOD domain-containing protein [Pseudomonadota bacterium]